MKLDSLPVQFKPYKELELASNKLIDGVALFSVNEFIPVLVGKGESPEIWLYIPADPKGESWQPLVKRNRSLHPKVEVKGTGKKVTVTTPDGVVLVVECISEDLALISRLDLRPFGINVFLENNSLNVMGNSMIGNTIKGAKVMIGIGG
jgi:hypothetical protein